MSDIISFEAYKKEHPRDLVQEADKELTDIVNRYMLIHNVELPKLERKKSTLNNKIKIEELKVESEKLNQKIISKVEQM